MKIGVDTSVLVAAVHANHPLHHEAARWLNYAFEHHEVVAAHHSVLESYAVLTRLPGQYRLSPTDAQLVLTETLRANALVAQFSESWTWEIIDTMVQTPASGGSSYDSFIIQLLDRAGVDCISTYNAAEFRRLAPLVEIVTPAEPM